MEVWYHYVLLALVGFLVGFINTMAGGGSLLTLPLLIFMGLPPATANGTNRIAVLVQGAANIMGYKSKGMPVATKFMGWLSLSATLGTLIGAKLALDIDEALFNRILAIVMLIIVLFMLFNRKKKLGNLQERLTGKYGKWGIIAFFFIGIYGGFIQAGTGIFMMLALSSINHMSLVKSNVAKAVTMFAYTVAALILFGLNGKLDWEVGLTLASGQALGGWVTSRWSVDKGDGVVRVVLIVMVTVMAIKLWFFN